MAVITLLLSIFIHLLIITRSVSTDEHWDEEDTTYFPQSIPIYPVRRDVITNEEVSRGRIKDILLELGKVRQEKMSYRDFVRTAQCSNPIPDLNGNRGAYSALRMVKLTKKYLETACAHIESNCYASENSCPQYIENAKNGTYARLNGIELYRLKANKLYLDRPWGQERLESPMNRLVNGDMRLFNFVLSNIKDIGDCFFFFGGEQAAFSWRFVVPIFSFAPNMKNSDLPFPWLESYAAEIKREEESRKANNFSDEYYSSHLSSWQERHSKAAFFASLSDGSPRQFVFDQAVLRPDLFHVSFSKQDTGLTAWNLNSDENTLQFRSNPHVLSDLTIDNQAGFKQSVMRFAANRGYNPKEYKYIIVPAGSGVLSTSGRLAQLLAHSGAVILLQEAGFNYPFSARLQAWVHYVPLAYNMADAIDKINWLVQHDDMAQQIAHNAKNFGKSYLRLEDYFCYLAMSLHLLSEMQKDDGVTEPSSKAMLLIDFN
jgi:hypothetical protein